MLARADGACDTVSGERHRSGFDCAPLPLLFDRSLQAQMLIPLVASLAFGLTAATVLVLFFVPALYGGFDDLGRARPAAPEPAAGAGSGLRAEADGPPG